MNTRADNRDAGIGGISVELGGGPEVRSAPRCQGSLREPPASPGSPPVLWPSSSPGSRSARPARRLAFLYSVPIGLAAWWFGLRPALLAAAACLALFAIGDAIHPISHFGLALVIRAAFFAGVAFLFSLLGRRLRLLEHSAEELEAIRAALTPADLPELAGVDAAAAFVPSELGVSGDFYLLTNGPDGSAVAIVGDVVGHGPAAARLATFVRARLPPSPPTPATRPSCCGSPTRRWPSGPVTRMSWSARSACGCTPTAAPSAGRGRATRRRCGCPS